MPHRFNATAFFKSLTEKNRLAISHGFQFCEVSDLQGFEEALNTAQSRHPLVCVSDTSAGKISLDTSPATLDIKTVFMYMPHAIQNNYMEARRKCFAIMREIFRQFMSVLIRQHSRLHLDGIYIEREVSFQEIDRYFFTGGACAFFQIAVDTATNLMLNPDEWTQEPTPPRLSTLDEITPSPSTTQ